LKNNKAAGFDIIINEMLKCGQTVLVKPLSKLFNIILSSGEYPSQWSKGYIYPIHKVEKKIIHQTIEALLLIAALGNYLLKF
jgi:hypothetical protein